MHIYVKRKCFCLYLSALVIQVIILLRKILFNFFELFFKLIYFYISNAFVLFHYYDRASRHHYCQLYITIAAENSNIVIATIVIGPSQFNTIFMSVPLHQLTAAASKKKNDKYCPIIVITR